MRDSQEPERANVVPFRRPASNEQMIAAIEEALRRMWARVAAEPLPTQITSLLERLEKTERER